MTTEKIRYVRAGDGGRGDIDLYNVYSKNWYPWEPDVISTAQFTKNWQEWTMPGGHKYTANNSDANNLNGGAWPQAELLGHTYDGRHSPQHQDSKYAIFAGNPNISKTHINAVKQGEGNQVTSNIARQYPSTLMISQKCYRNKTYHGNWWACYSQSYGYPLPCYGVTMDITPTLKGGYWSLSGLYGQRDTADTDYGCDYQINQVHGLWMPQGAATVNDYVSKKLYPNGNNWEGRSDVNNGKYVFRDGSSFAMDKGHNYLGRSSQHYALVDTGKNGNEKSFKLNMMLPYGEKPPAKSLFMGITVQMCFGEWASASKTTSYFIHNMGVIDKLTYDIILNKPEYSGINPKTSDLPYMLCPRLLRWDTLRPKDVPLYGDMQDW